MVTSIVSATSILYFLPLGGVLKADEYYYYDYYDYYDYDDCMDEYDRRNYTWVEVDEICSEENEHLDGWQIRVTSYAATVTALILIA